VKKSATFDSSFWVHAVYLDLVDFLLQDYQLFCTPAVENELGRANPTGLRLKALLADGQIQRDKAGREKVKLYGDGERAAINLALEKRLLLLIDDWKPYQAALESGVEVVNSLVYVVRLYQQDRLSVERVLAALAKMTRRGTIKPEWIHAALEMVALIRQTRTMKGD
jgi:predicted nucleic acid-binding protein